MLRWHGITSEAALGEAGATVWRVIFCQPQQPTDGYQTETQKLIARVTYYEPP